MKVQTSWMDEQVVGVRWPGPNLLVDEPTIISRPRPWRTGGTGSSHAESNHVIEAFFALAVSIKHSWIGVRGDDFQPDWRSTRIQCQELYKASNQRSDTWDLILTRHAMIISLEYRNQ